MSRKPRLEVVNHQMEVRIGAVERSVEISCCLRADGLANHTKE